LRVLPLLLASNRLSNLRVLKGADSNRLSQNCSAKAPLVPVLNTLLQYPLPNKKRIYSRSFKEGRVLKIILKNKAT
jgi:hypothetical protein